MPLGQFFFWHLQAIKINQSLSAQGDVIAARVREPSTGNPRSGGSPKCRCQGAEECAHAIQELSADSLPAGAAVTWVWVKAGLQVTIPNSKAGHYIPNY